MEINPQVEAPPGTKWTEEELEQLRSAITMFGDDMSKVASKIKTRSLQAIKNKLKKEGVVPQRIAVNNTPFAHPVNPQQIHRLMNPVLNHKKDIETYQKQHSDDEAQYEVIDTETVSMDDFSHLEATAEVEGGMEGNSNQTFNSYISSSNQLETDVAHPSPVPPLDIN